LQHSKRGLLRSTHKKERFIKRSKENQYMNLNRAIKGTLEGILALSLLIGAASCKAEGKSTVNPLQAPLTNTQQLTTEDTFLVYGPFQEVGKEIDYQSMTAIPKTEGCSIDDNLFSPRTAPNINSSFEHEEQEKWILINDLQELEKHSVEKRSGILEWYIEKRLKETKSPLPPTFVKATLYTESTNLDWKTSPKGAKGYMQVTANGVRGLNWEVGKKELKTLREKIDKERDKKEVPEDERYTIGWKAYVWRYTTEGRTLNIEEKEERSKVYIGVTDGAYSWKAVATNPQENINTGIAVLEQCYKEKRGDLERTAECYNAGSNARTNGETTKYISGLGSVMWWMQRLDNGREYTNIHQELLLAQIAEKEAKKEKRK
jgi:hypothetical protein